MAFRILPFVAAALTILFLAHCVSAGEVFAFDRHILLALRHADGVPIGSARFASAVRDVTALGGATVLTLAVAIAAAVLASTGRWRAALLTIAATGIGCWANGAIKHVVARARPDLVPHLMQETSSSFPSGHAAHSAVVYLTIALLVLPMTTRRATRRVVIGAAVAIVALVGASRVYLGVHWPSDVIAGWLFGGLWAITWWRIEVRLFPREAAGLASAAASRHSGVDTPGRD